jgi:hypothetical protein
MTTFKELADQLDTTTDHLRDFSPAEVGDMEDDAELHLDTEAGLREAVTNARKEADAVTAEGLDGAAADTASEPDGQ